MRILYGYLRNYWKLAATALVLAAINQIFSLLDPLIFRYIIDNYATKYSQYTSAQFIRGVSVPAGGGGGRGVRFARRQEFPGLLRQPDHAAGGRATSMPTAYGTRWNCPTRCSKTSAAAKLWANCKRCGPTWRS